MVMRGQGLSLRSISRHLNRHISSLSRKLKRNRTAHYYEVIQACALRWRQSMLESPHG
ncbi:hypothetical protein CWE14_14675 [Aliidiomarina soli]|uniref:Transposase IS30-like HTH domain-containing protein n=2 Tax=Aliidiomarina soli TaxID=1928574 RepID=A0A432WCB7_9GAMM|nr:hypothetical protein CWE14_14675 [Aliidiomarina soli]